MTSQKLTAKVLQPYWKAVPTFLTFTEVSFSRKESWLLNFVKSLLLLVAYGTNRSSMNNDLNDDIFASEAKELVYTNTSTRVCFLERSR